MTTTRMSPDLLGEVVEDARRAHGVPGAAVAVLHDGMLVEAASGVASVRTGRPHLPGTRSHTGSVQKLVTAAAVLRLVQAGACGLDDPVRRHLPGFQVASQEATDAVTVRHLLAHSSGIDGDLHLVDTGSDARALARYVTSCGSLRQLFGPGELTSYCNAGFSILGRLVERLSGTDYEQAVTASVLRPAGMGGSGFRVEGDVADGHFGGPADPRAHPADVSARGLGPAGATLLSPTGDLVRLADSFGRGNLVGAGLREESRRPQPVRSAGVPPRGLGWELLGRGDRLVLSHDGATSGITTAVRAVPDEAVAVAVCCNAARGPRFTAQVVDVVLGELLGDTAAVQPVQPVRAVPPARPVDGAYGRLGCRLTVATDTSGAPRLSGTVEGRRVDATLYRAGADWAYGDSIFGPLSVRFLPASGSGPDADMLAMQGRVARRVPA